MWSTIAVTGVVLGLCRALPLLIALRGTSASERPAIIHALNQRSSTEVVLVVPAADRPSIAMNDDLMSQDDQL